MLQLTIPQSSVDSIESYLERVRLRIFQGMREGMQEAMDGLAGETVYQAMAAGIHSKSGQLFTDILNSTTVGETPQWIVGKVHLKSNMTVGKRTFEGYLATALDEGYHVPQSKSSVYQFASADGDTVYSRGHVAFDVKPHPFLRRSKEQFAAPIMEIIERRVAEAYS